MVLKHKILQEALNSNILYADLSYKKPKVTLGKIIITLRPNPNDLIKKCNFQGINREALTQILTKINAFKGQILITPPSKETIEAYTIFEQKILNIMDYPTGLGYKLIKHTVIEYQSVCIRIPPRKFLAENTDIIKRILQEKTNFLNQELEKDKKTYLISKL